MFLSLNNRVSRPPVFRLSFHSLRNQGRPSRLPLRKDRQPPMTVWDRKEPYICSESRNESKDVPKEEKDTEV